MIETIAFDLLHGVGYSLIGGELFRRGIKIKRYFRAKSSLEQLKRIYKLEVALGIGDHWDTSFLKKANSYIYGSSLEGFFDCFVCGKKQAHRVFGGEFKNKDKRKIICNSCLGE